MRTSPAPPSSLVTVLDLFCMVIRFGHAGLPASPWCHLLTLYKEMNMSHVTTNRLNLDDEVIPCNFSSMANRYFARSFRRSR